MKLATRYYADPKVEALDDATEVMFVRSLALAGEREQGGFIPTSSLPLLARRRRYGTCVDALVAAGLWIPVDGGYRITRWSDRQAGLDRLAKIRATDRERKRRQRAVEKTKSDAMSTGQSSGCPPPKSKRIDSSQSTRLEVTHEDDELSTGSVPGETWEHYARLKLGQQTGVRNPQPWLAKCRRNAEHELAEQAERWWATFEVDPYRLAQALVDGNPPRNVPRRQEAS